MAELKITNLCKKYEDDFEAVRDFNLEARDGEFIVIVGPPAVESQQRCE